MINVAFTQDELETLTHVVECAADNNKDSDVLSALHKKLKDMSFSPQSIEQRIIEPLIKAGLAAKMISVNPLRITGGRSSEETDGFTMYQEGFSIFEDLDTNLYHACKVKGNIGEAFRTPEECVKWIIDLYSGKIKPKSDPKGVGYRFR